MGWGRLCAAGSIGAPLPPPARRASCRSRPSGLASPLGPQVYQSINPNPAASAKVPILVDEDGTKLIESQLIVDYLEQRYPQARLLPEDPVAAYRARLWVDAFSSQFTPAIFALLRAADADGVAAGKAKLEAALTVGQGVKGAGPALRRCAGAQR